MSIISVTPGTIIAIEEIGAQLYCALNDDGQPYVGINTEDLASEYTYGEHNSLPIMCVTLNDATLYDDEGHGDYRTGAVDAMRADNVTDALNLLAQAAGRKDYNPSADPVISALGTMSDHSRTLLLDVLRESGIHGSDELADAIASSFAIERRDDAGESIEDARNRLRELEGEGEFRDIPVGHVDSLSDEQVRERLIELGEDDS